MWWMKGLWKEFNVQLSDNSMGFDCTKVQKQSNGSYMNNLQNLADITVEIHFWKVTFNRELFLFVPFAAFIATVTRADDQMLDKLHSIVAQQIIKDFNKNDRAVYVCINHWDTIPSDIKLTTECFVLKVFQKGKAMFFNSDKTLLKKLWRTKSQNEHLFSHPWRNITFRVFPWIALTKMKYLCVSTVTSVRVVVPNDTQRNCKINVYDYILRLLLSSFQHKTRQGSPPTMTPFVILNCKNQEE